MPLLGPQEKVELEGMIHSRFTAYWDEHGSAKLVSPGRSVVLKVNGPAIASKHDGAALGSVEIRTLFTAVCHLSSEGADSLPRESLDTLAKEAAAALAAQVNRLSSD